MRGRSGWARPRLAIVVLACVSLLAACSSSGGSNTPAAQTSPPASPATAAATPTVEASSLPPIEIQVGQMLMAGVEGQTAGDDARHMIADLDVGNVILMGRNAGTPAQVAALTDGLQQLAKQQTGIPLLIGTDQEGGEVQRLTDGFTLLPDAVTVGDADRPDLARSYGKMVGDELSAVGVNLDFAPVLDVNDNPNNPVIGPRAFGSRPDIVVRNGIAFALGLRDAGIIGIGKHFPGHGNTSVNSHVALPVVTKSLDDLRAVEFAPFEAAIKAGIDGLMVAHVAYPALDPSGLPATVSSPIVGDLLRGQMGFTGVVFTDDMGMKGIADVMSLEQASVKAIQAGADILLCVREDEADSCKPGDIERMRAALLAAVRDGTLPASRIEQSYKRIVALKQNYRVGTPGLAPISQVGSAAHAGIVDAILRAAGK